jgi:cytochrome c biogenesis protein CcdA
MDTKVAGLFVLFIGLEILALSIAQAFGLSWETKCRLIAALVILAGLACTFYLSLEKDYEH